MCATGPDLEGHYERHSMQQRLLEDIDTLENKVSSTTAARIVTILHHNLPFPQNGLDHAILDRTRLLGRTSQSSLDQSLVVLLLHSSHCSLVSEILVSVIVVAVDLGILNRQLAILLVLFVVLAFVMLAASGPNRGNDARLLLTNTLVAATITRSVTNNANGTRRRSLNPN